MTSTNPSNPLTPLEACEQLNASDALAWRTCPTTVRTPDDLVGCGAAFIAFPDREGLVDCPLCGMWHKVAR